MKDFIFLDTNTNPASKHYKNLDKKTKDLVDRFEKYILLTAGKGRANKGKTCIIRFLAMANKDPNKLDLEDLRDFLLKLRKADLSDYSRNDNKNFVHRFLKWNFKDWSERFNSFEDIKYDHEAERKTKITPEDIITPAEVKMLIEKEPDLKWKAFLSLQYFGALRTKEVIVAEWKRLNTEDSETYWLEVISKKNKKGKEKTRIIPLGQEAIYFLDKLKELNTDNSPYLFPSPFDPLKPMGSGVVNKWFSRHTKKHLGKARTNYILRHSRGEELHKLVRLNKLSKENATAVMGHTEEMFDKTYSHKDIKQFKEVLKNQVLGVIPLAPEKKHELLQRIEAQDKKILNIQKQLALFLKKSGKL